MKNYQRIAGTKAPLLDASLVVGKYLKLAKPTRRYWGYPNSNDYDEVPAGQIFGPVYSWLTRGKDVWWQIATTDPGVYYYAKHAPGIFDINYLQQQFPDGQFPPAPKVEIPTWAGAAIAAFGLYQASQPEYAKHKLLIQLGSFGVGAWTIANALSKVDFNPFD